MNAVVIRLPRPQTPLYTYFVLGSCHHWQPFALSQTKSLYLIAFSTWKKHSIFIKTKLWHPTISIHLFQKITGHDHFNIFYYLSFSIWMGIFPFPPLLLYTGPRWCHNGHPFRLKQQNKMAHSHSFHVKVAICIFYLSLTIIFLLSISGPYLTFSCLS